VGFRLAPGRHFVSIHQMVPLHYYDDLLVVRTCRVMLLNVYICNNELNSWRVAKCCWWKRQIMRSSLDYAGFAQLCGSTCWYANKRAHDRTIPLSLLTCAQLLDSVTTLWVIIWSCI